MSITKNIYSGIYSIDFSSFTSNINLKQTLINDNYWVYSYLTKPDNFDNPNLFSRISLKDDYLHLLKDKDDEDYSNTNLNPRTELRLNSINFEKEKDYFVNFVNKIPSLNFEAIFFQIMSRNNDNNARPLFQLQIRNQQFTLRYIDNEVNKQKYLFLSETFLNKDLNWSIYFKLSKTSGYYVIKLNGKIIIQKDLNNVFRNDNVWIQFGVYAINKDKIDMEIYYKNLNIYKHIE